jgi:redox-sensitive bicupin YhaK (pirin superfamily)
MDDRRRGARAFGDADAHNAARRRPDGGIQLWVNLPRTDKLAMPRYQDLTGDRLTLLRTADERALVRLVAGELDGHHGPGSTYTPIVYAHATIKPGGRLALAWPDVYNALVYVVRGSVRVADDSRPINAQQLAVLGREGDTVVVEADEESDVLLLGGRPLREPIAWYGPFVMNTKQEIIDAVDDFEAGRMGSIAPEHA